MDNMKNAILEGEGAAVVNDGALLYPVEPLHALSVRQLIS